MPPESRITADENLVRRLLNSQAPEFAGLPLERVVTAGVNNTIYRLGKDLAVRMPHTAWCGEHIRKEQRWLPVLAKHLSLGVPTLVRAGSPGDTFPWHWSIYAWLAGDDATHRLITDENLAAQQLASFVTELHQVPTDDGPPAGEHSGMRGLPLAVRDQVVRDALGSINAFDVQAATMVWDAAVALPEWPGPPVWLHGDLHPGNVLVRDGALSAVIDWEMANVGDPALDLSGAWMLLNEPARQSFRQLLNVDDDTWARGRGWALCIGVIAASYYQESNPVLAGFSRRGAQEVLDDFRRHG